MGDRGRSWPLGGVGRTNQSLLTLFPLLVHDRAASRGVECALSHRKGSANTWVTESLL